MSHDLEVTLPSFSIYSYKVHQNCYWIVSFKHKDSISLDGCEEVGRVTNFTIPQEDPRWLEKFLSFSFKSMSTRSFNMKCYVHEDVDCIPLCHAPINNIQASLSPMHNPEVTTQWTNKYSGRPQSKLFSNCGHPRTTFHLESYNCPY